jgi:hypothetical protein
MCGAHMEQMVTSPSPLTGGRRRRSIARATGKAAGSSAKEKREGARARRGELDGYAPPEGEGATGNAAVKEAGAAGGGGASGVVEGEE